MTSLSRSFSTASRIITPTMSQPQVTPQWVLGPGNTPFYTKTWSPSNPKAYVLFVHGFAEHIERYTPFFTSLTSTYPLHVTAFDQRGHGKTSQDPLTAKSPEVRKWKEEGKEVRLEKNAKRRTGGWGQCFTDMEWFLKSVIESATGKPVFLWGFSMGGGQSLAFPIQPSAPPSPDTIQKLSGVISGGPLIKLSNKPPALQVKAGTLAANIGLGNFLIPTPMDYTHLSHNPETNEKAKSDPFCEQSGSIRGVADFIHGGEWLDSADAWDRWPAKLPLLLYHGGDDRICDVNASKRFVENVKAENKTIKVFDAMYHEVHNEAEPVPTELIQLVAQWVDGIIEATPLSTAAPNPGLSKL
ncbi:hypothetical protein IAR50_000206 [Cryptococcus sp. DSM 104548]